MAKQVKKWITINGNHVPVYEDGSLGGIGANLQQKKDDEWEDYDEQDKLEAIAERYTGSKPVSGNWDTEVEHEQAAIAKELGISKEEAKQKMIDELGFEEDQFNDKSSKSQFGEAFDNQVKEYTDKFLTKRSDEEIAEIKKNLDKSTAIVGTTEDDHVALTAIRQEQERRTKIEDDDFPFQSKEPSREEKAEDWSRETQKDIAAKKADIRNMGYAEAGDFISLHKEEFGLSEDDDSYQIAAQIKNGDIKLDKDGKVSKADRDKVTEGLKAMDKAAKERGDYIEDEQKRRYSDEHRSKTGPLHSMTDDQVMEAALQGDRNAVDEMSKRGLSTTKDLQEYKNRQKGSKPSLNDIKGYGYDPHDATGDPTIITADGRSYYKIGDDKWVAHSDSGRALSGSISDKQMVERLANAKDVKVNSAAKSNTGGFSAEAAAKDINAISMNHNNRGGDTENDWKKVRDTLEAAPAGTVMIQTGDRGAKYQFTKGEDGQWHGSWDSDSKTLSMGWVGQGHRPEVEFTTPDKALSSQQIKDTQTAAVNGKLNQQLGLDKNGYKIGNRSTPKVDVPEKSIKIGDKQVGVSKDPHAAEKIASAKKMVANNESNLAGLRDQLKKHPNDEHTAEIKAAIKKAEGRVKDSKNTLAEREGSTPKYKTRDDYENADNYRKGVLRKQFENNSDPYKLKPGVKYTDEQVAYNKAASENWNKERDKYMASKSKSIKVGNKEIGVNKGKTPSIRDIVGSDGEYQIGKAYTKSNMMEIAEAAGIPRSKTSKMTVAELRKMMLAMWRKG